MSFLHVDMLGDSRPSLLEVKLGDVLRPLLKLFAGDSATCRVTSRGDDGAGASVAGSAVLGAATEDSASITRRSGEGLGCTEIAPRSHRDRSEQTPLLASYMKRVYV